MFEPTRVSKKRASGFEPSGHPHDREAPPPVLPRRGGALRRPSHPLRSKGQVDQGDQLRLSHPKSSNPRAFRRNAPVGSSRAASPTTAKRQRSVPVTRLRNAPPIPPSIGQQVHTPRRVPRLARRPARDPSFPSPAPLPDHPSRHGSHPLHVCGLQRIQQPSTEFRRQPQEIGLINQKSICPIWQGESAALRPYDSILDTNA